MDALLMVREAAARTGAPVDLRVAPNGWLAWLFWVVTGRVWVAGAP